ncbi:hypothetical protein BH09MYX1_BH09MYX1_08840 [soil metagenome]
MIKITPPIPPRPPGLDAALDELVFSTWDQDFLKTEPGVRGREDVVVTRFEDALRFTIPWLSEHVDLANARIVEIGCGSGSSTVALGLHAKSVQGYDIDDGGVRATRARAAAYGLTNVNVFTVTPDALLSAVIEHATDANVFMLYAVLEHLTYPERIETLTTLWNALPPGGLLVVVETPNRLTYVDRHTTELEFFHLLPDELAIALLDRVPRDAFKASMREPVRRGAQAAALSRIRWGLGASYHEFLVSIHEPLADIVVADGFETEMTQFFYTGIDETLLVKFFLEQPVTEPIGFARGVLNVILRKPSCDDDRAAARAFNAERRRLIAAPPPLPLPPPPPPQPPPPPTIRGLIRERIRKRFGL